MRVIAARYELTREVGRGGMGAAWEAFDRSLHRQVALKLMFHDKLDSPSSRERFEREARALAQIRNDHIVAVHDYGIDEGSPYIVMELLEGEDLEQRLERDQRLAPAVLAKLLLQIARGLGAATAVDIVHRDLKPANIFLSRAREAPEQVKLLDFGVAWTRAEAQASGHPQGLIVGTPSYMSPEQARGLAPTHASDLWALGVIAYRSLTGQLPFQRKRFSELVVAISSEPPPPPSTLVEGLSTDFDAFFERALAKRPEARFQSASALAGAFARICEASSATKILVVDDEPDVRLLMRQRFRRQIRRSLYELEFAENGEQAIAQLHAHPDIEVILCDINMPVMDGLTFLEQIRELAPYTRTIMVSAYGDMANIRRSMNAGAFDFVVKPVDYTDLVATIAKATNSIAAQRKADSLDAQNEVLRRFVPELVGTRIDEAGANAQFESALYEGTVVVVEIDTVREGHARTVAEHVRALNARLELVVPELRAREGVVGSLEGGTVLVAYLGDAHLQRALEACNALADQQRALAELAGAESPYAEGLRFGVATGQISLGCLGSHACGRLNYTMSGSVIDEARHLARVASSYEVLASERAAELSAVNSFGSAASGYRLLLSRGEHSDSTIAMSSPHTLALGDTEVSETKS